METVAPPLEVLCGPRLPWGISSNCVRPVCNSSTALPLYPVRMLIAMFKNTIVTFIKDKTYCRHTRRDMQRSPRSWLSLLSKLELPVLLPARYYLTVYKQNVNCKEYIPSFHKHSCCQGVDASTVDSCVLLLQWTDGSLVRKNWRIAS